MLWLLTYSWNIVEENLSSLKTNVFFPQFLHTIKSSKWRCLNLKPFSILLKHINFFLSKIKFSDFLPLCHRTWLCQCWTRVLWRSWCGTGCGPSPSRRRWSHSRGAQIIILFSLIRFFSWNVPWKLSFYLCFQKGVFFSKIQPSTLSERSSWFRRSHSNLCRQKCSRRPTGRCL